MFGILYIALGVRCRREVLWSIRSVRQMDCCAQIRVLTDAPCPALDRESVEVVLVPPRVSSQFVSRFFKTRLYEFSPFEITLYLDTDTIAIQPFEDIWDFAPGVSMAIDILPQWSAVRAQFDCAETLYTDRLVVPQAPYHNAGVLLFSRGAKERLLFETWAAEWDRFQQFDQRSFARALAHTGYPIRVLPRSFNFWPLGETTRAQAIAQGARIVHLLGHNKAFYSHFIPQEIEYAARASAG